MKSIRRKGGNPLKGGTISRDEQKKGKFKTREEGGREGDGTERGRKRRGTGR